MDQLLDILLPYVGIIFVYMSGLFGVSILIRRNDVADVGWGLGFILVSAVSAWFGGGSVSGLLATALVTLWGTRIALHIYLRNKDKEEDFRYKNWRNNWGKYFYVRSYFQVFILQGILMFLISLPVVLSNLFFTEYSLVFLIIGFIVWTIGFIFESVGDYQLGQFVSEQKNKGKIMMSGLWAFTRHPNYFGEVAMWWGIFIICMPHALWLLMLLSPLAITILILKVSGIPMLEKKYEGNPEFQAYKQRVSAFFPWFPKK